VQRRAPSPDYLNISDAIFITNDLGEFTYVCPNTAIIFGYSQDEVEALGNVTKLMGPILFDPLQLESREQIDNIEWTINDKGGLEHVLIVNVKRVSIQGGHGSLYL
jgi:PAS domain S-box-containing protein